MKGLLVPLGALFLVGYLTKQILDYRARQNALKAAFDNKRKEEEFK